VWWWGDRMRQEGGEKGEGRKNNTEEDENI